MMGCRACRLLDLIASALDLPRGYFEPHFVDPILTLRPIHYTAEQSDVEGGVFGAGPYPCSLHATVTNVALFIRAALQCSLRKHISQSTLVSHSQSSAH